jgi:hypothetical protein
VSRRLAVILVLALALLGPLAAEAHRRPDATPPSPDLAGPSPAAVTIPAPDPPPVLRAAPSLSASPWLVAAALGGAIGLRVLGRSREARRWALVLLLASFSAEMAVHAVHHLEDPRGAAGCYALSLGQHLSAASPPAPDLHGPARAAGALLGPSPEPAAASALRAPDRGRAPPLHTT